MKYIIGLDIGGTKIHGALYIGAKKLKELTIATPKNLPDFKRAILKLTDFLSAGKKIGAAGVGMAGLIDAEKGAIKSSPNLKFTAGLNLVNLLNSHGLKSVKIDNDANCFTRAEMVEGQGKNKKNFIAITLGTGIGGGVVIDKKIYRCFHNLGGELGHIVSGEDFLEKQYQKFRDAKNYSAAGKLLGKSLASFINIFAPDAIIIGGSYGINESSKYLPAAKSEIKKFTLNQNLQTKILISKLKNAGTLGAALLFS